MPPNTITSTGFSLPLAVLDSLNVTDPNNILLPDGDFAQLESGSTITIGNFDYAIPSNAVITGFEIEVLGLRGAQTVPAIQLDIYALDNTTGTDLLYPYAPPFTGLTPTNTAYTLGGQNYVFATAWTADQANNFKLQIGTNGDVFLDTIRVNVFYYIPSPTPAPTPVPSGCIDCNSPIQVQTMRLELPFLVNETKFYLQKGSFAYADGTPVQPGDVGTCDGDIDFVFDPAKRKQAGGNFAENLKVDTTVASWIVLPSGVIEVDITNVIYRGLKFHTPYDHDATLMSNHDANSEVIISNSGAFYARFVRACQVDIVFSAPIATLKDDVLIEPATHAYNYIGAGVSVVPNGTDPQQMDVTIPGVGGIIPPLLVGTGSGTSGNVQVLTLDYTVESSGTDRGALVQISTEELVTIVSVDIGGTPAIQLVSDTDVPNNIRQEQWGCAAQPVGTLTVTITLSALAYISSGVETFANVDQVTPFGAVNNATGASNTPSVILATTSDYSIVVDGLATALTPILYTPGAGQTTAWSETANTDTRQGGASYEAAGTAVDNVTMDYSITQNTDWVITAVEVIGLTLPTPPANPLEIQDEGVTVDANTVLINFIGAGVAATPGVNPGEVDVTIPGGAPGADELVKVSAADTTSAFLDTKITVISSDGSVNVTPSINNPGANEELEFDLSTLGVPPTVVAEQYLSSFGDGDGPSQSGIMQTDSTGDVLYVGTIINEPNGNAIVTRYAKDTNTGFFYKTHVSTSLGGVVPGIKGIAVLGSFIYVFYFDVTGECTRLSAADLTGATLMTISGTGFGTSGIRGAFTDGTNLFVADSSTNFNEYSVAGTTITFVQTITGALANTTDATYDTTNSSVYMSSTTGAINRYTIIGAAFVLQSTITRVLPAFVNAVSSGIYAPAGLTITSPGSVLVYCTYNFSWGGSDTMVVILKTFSRPA